MDAGTAVGADRCKVGEAGSTRVEQVSSGSSKLGLGRLELVPRSNAPILSGATMAVKGR